MLHKRLDFRTEKEQAVGDCVEERVDAEVIASEEQGLLLAVVNNKSKLPVDLVQEVDAFVFIQVQQDFDVAVSAEDVSFLLKRVSELAIVVDLAVAEKDERAVFAVDRLVAAGEIDNAQASEAGPRCVRLDVISASNDREISRSFFRSV